MGTSRVRLNRTLLTAAVALVATATASNARASGARYRLQVVRADGAASCPAAIAIQHDVERRLGREPFADEGERGIEIVLERSEAGFRARLYLRIDPNEPDAARVIESDAPDCAELGKAVSLAVSLAIAPELPQLDVTPPAEPPPCPPPAPVLPPAVPPPSWHGNTTILGLWSPNLLPSSSGGAAVTVTLRGDLLGVRLGGMFHPETKLRAGQTELGFGVTAGLLSGCLWARTLDPEVWSCIGGRVGALHSVVYAPVPQKPGDRLWAAASTDLGVRKRLVGRAFVEAGATAVFPLVRHRFLVDAESTPAYEQGPAALEAFLGLGVRLD